MNLETLERTLVLHSGVLASESDSSIKSPPLSVRRGCVDKIWSPFEHCLTSEPQIVLTFPCACPALREECPAHLRQSF